MVNILAEAAAAVPAAADAAKQVVTDAAAKLATTGSILEGIDWAVIGVFFAIVLGIGIVASRTAGKNTKEFFLGGRGMPWWLLGVSMVACTFSCDTPNLVTGMVRENGVAKNWAWWAFLITGMVTVFIYAQLWRRTKVMTDLEFYELRYSGKPAAFLRGFRALYLGVLFNCLIMGSVTLAAIKIGGVMLGIPPFETVLYASVFVVIYATIGGIKGVIWADFFQYSIAMGGAVYAAYIAVSQPEVGGLAELFNHPNVADKLAFFPNFQDPNDWVPLLLIPIAVQWWAAWYPGAEPGGGGYVAQRMLAAKDEKNAIGATLFFNFMHYAMRPWPWIIVALASLVVFPDLASLREAFPDVDPTYVKDDIAYPAMLTRLSPGFLGLVVASLIAAYMSTIGTHLNWGSSYAVNDFYKRFIKPKASEKELVKVGRICTVLLMLISGTLALTILNSATQAFSMLILAGAGSGAIYLLRWFWWRINAWSEIIAMIVTTIFAVALTFFIEDKTLDWEVTATFTLKGGTMKFLVTVLATTVTWLVTTLLTKPENNETLRRFYKFCHPGGPGWRKVVKVARAEGLEIDSKDYAGSAWKMPIQLLCIFFGSVAIYCSLFSVGCFVYSSRDVVLAGGLGYTEWGYILGGVALVSVFILFKCFGKLGAESNKEEDAAHAE